MSNWARSTFWLEGSGHYGNPDRVVHLYDYLLAGARVARTQAVRPNCRAVHAIRRRRAGRAAPVARQRHCRDCRFPMAPPSTPTGRSYGTAHPGGEFYVRPRAGQSLGHGDGRVPDGAGGRVVTGVARDDVNNRLTPVALAVRAPVAVDFHLRWQPGHGAAASAEALLESLGG